MERPVPSDCPHALLLQISGEAYVHISQKGLSSPFVAFAHLQPLGLGKEKHFSFASWPVGCSQAASENVAVGAPGMALWSHPARAPPACVCDRGRCCACERVRGMGLTRAVLEGGEWRCFQQFVSTVGGLSGQGLHPNCTSQGQAGRLWVHPEQTLLPEPSGSAPRGAGHGAGG